MAHLDKLMLEQHVTKLITGCFICGLNITYNKYLVDLLLGDEQNSNGTLMAPTL